MALQELKTLIIANFGTQRQFAKAMGVTESAVSRYLSGEREWNAKIVVRAARALNMNYDDVEYYFFDHKGAKGQPLKK